MGELDEVLELFEPGSTVLELGCGTGRLCAHLAARGLHVTGVDEALEMLACVPAEVTPVQSSIETLNLGAQYDTVLLASHLINHPSAQARAAFVQCAWRHLKPKGRFILKRHDCAWLRGVQVGPVGQRAGVSYHVEAVARAGETVSMTLRYGMVGQTWRHSFSTVALSQGDVETLLLPAGFTSITWHGSNHLWAAAQAP